MLSTAQAGGGRTGRRDCRFHPINAATAAAKKNDVPTVIGTVLLVVTIGLNRNSFRAVMKPEDEVQGKIGRNAIGFVVELAPYRPAACRGEVVSSCWCAIWRC